MIALALAPWLPAAAAIVHSIEGHTHGSRHLDVSQALEIAFHGHDHESNTPGHDHPVTIAGSPGPAISRWSEVPGPSPVTLLHGPVLAGLPAIIVANSPHSVHGPSPPFLLRRSILRI